MNIVRVTHLKNHTGILKLTTVFVFLFGGFILSLQVLVKPAVAQSLLPPATYYGWITPTTGFVPTAGMSVKALVNGVVCGQTTVEARSGKLAYTLQVTAENPVTPTNGCGTTTRTVVFQVGTWTMNHDRMWSNSQAWFHSLNRIKAQARSLPLDQVLFLPIVQR
jgi:hypothetical protein